MDRKEVCAKLMLLQRISIEAKIKRNIKIHDYFYIYMTAAEKWAERIEKKKSFRT